MDISQKILSDITVHMKYAKYIPELTRRETWNELVTRNKEMHQKKYPKIKGEIEEVYQMVYDKKILPSNLVTAGCIIFDYESSDYVNSNFKDGIVKEYIFPRQFM